MSNNLFRNIIVLIVIFLFLGLTVQSNKSINIEQYNNQKLVQTIEPMDNINPKEYLFETIILIANNPDVKDLFTQYKSKMFISDYDFNSIFKQLLIKNPRLLYLMIFTKPSLSYDYLDKSYNRGIEFFNILNEEIVLKIKESIIILDQVFLENLKYIITNNEEISNRISALEDMNIKLKTDLLLQDNPIICSMIIIIESYIYMIYETSFELFHYFLSVNNTFFSVIFGNIKNFSEAFLTVVYMIGDMFECWYP